MEHGSCSLGDPGSPLAGRERERRIVRAGGSGRRIEIEMSPGWTERIRARVRDSRWNPLGTIVRIDVPEPMIALTFDDGPDPEYTPRILDVLDQHGAVATFFMIGAEARRHPELVAEVDARGHCVANHTDTHRSLPTLSRRERRMEIRRCAEALAPHGTRLFRPPKGHQTLGSRLDTLWCLHSPVAWSVAADDWKAHEPEWLASQVLEKLAPGEIVLLHDGLWDPESRRDADRQPVVDAVRMILQRCADRYRFESLPRMLALGSPVRHSWFVEPPQRRDAGLR